MAGILDALFGGNGQNALGSPSWAEANAGGPVPPAPAAPSRNPFGSALMASDAPGIMGFLGRLSGNPTTDEIAMRRLGSEQAQGLSGLQRRISAGMPVQQAIVDFVGSPEGQQFFGSSQDPIGAIKGYLQLSQKAPDKFEAVSPGSTIANLTTGQMTDQHAPTMQAQEVSDLASLAKLDPQQTQDFAKAMLQKNTNDPNNPTQAEDAMRGLVAAGIVTPEFAKKKLAGLIQVIPTLDAAGNKTGVVVADLSKMAQTGNTNDVTSVVVGGQNGGASGNLPAGQSVDVTTGQKTKIPGEIIFGAGTVGNFANTFGKAFGNIDPSMATQQYTGYKVALAKIHSDVQNLLGTNRQMAAQMKVYQEMVDQDGWTSNPIDQAQALQTLQSTITDRLGQINERLTSGDPLMTNTVKEKLSQEREDIIAILHDMPTPEDLEAAKQKALAGQGTIIQGVQEGAKHVGQAIESLTKTGKAVVGAGENAASEATGGAIGSSGAGTPKVFKTEQEAAQAAKAGTLHDGDAITVGGVSGHWSDK